MKRTILVTASLLALSLTGCSSDQASAPTAEPSNEATSAQDASVSPVAEPAAEESSTAPADAGKESERGNLIKQVGEMASINDETGKPIIDFTIEKMTMDPKCNGQWKDKPENGHFILLEVTAKTYRNVDAVNSNGWMLNPYQFKVIQKDGTTSNASAGTTAGFECFNDNKYLPTMGDSEKAAGYVVLDVEDPTGTLIYEENYADAGWEWEYPAK